MSLCFCSDTGIQTMQSASSEAPAPQQFAQLLRELISQYGALERSNTAPPVNIKKLLSELAQDVDPSVQVPQDSIQAQVPPYPPLTLVNKPNLTTAEAAYYLNRRPQTLRGWAYLENFPTGLRCNRIGGLLAWNTNSVKALVAGGTA
jgi:hypothetical protein